MKPHHFAHDDDHDRCALCNETSDHPIHELDGVPPGDAEDDFTPPDDEEPEFSDGPETVATVACLFEDAYGQEMP